MISALPPPACAIRPPWPDEFPRLCEAFPRFPRGRALKPLVVVTATEPARLVGFAAVFPSRKGAAQVALALRPRFESSAADQLIAAAVRLAAAEPGVDSVTSDDLPENDPLLPAWRRAGFAPQRTMEVWHVEIAAIRARLSEPPAGTEISRARFTIEPMRPTLIEPVQELMETAGVPLAGPVRLRNAATPDGCELALSFVVMDGARLVGAVLGRRRGNSVLVEGHAVRPEFNGRFNLPNHLLSRHYLQAYAAAGATELVFVADTVQARATILMARRSGGRCASRTVRLAWSLA